MSVRSDPIRILVADDHTLVRKGICSLLRDMEGVQVVAEAADGQEALRLIETQQPDVVFLDIAMPQLNGMEVVARVKKKYSAVRVVMLSMHENPEDVRKALQAGADGYLVKGASIAELEVAIQAVLRGDVYLSSAVSRGVISEPLPGDGDARGPLEKLTSRQREILQLIAEGHSTKEIAAILNLGVKTVATHRMQVMERLDIHDVAGLVRLAIRLRLISP